MRIFIYILIALSFGIIAFNSTLLDFENLLKGDSAVALIGILAAACVIVLLIILLISRSIAEKSR